MTLGHKISYGLRIVFKLLSSGKDEKGKKEEIFFISKKDFKRVQSTPTMSLMN